VPKVGQKAKLALVALTGAVVGAALSRLRRPAAAPSAPADERTQELRRKLAEAREAVADQDDFEVAGMGAETIVEEPPRTEAPAPEPETLPAPAEPKPEPEPKSEPEPKPSAPPAKPKAPKSPPAAGPAEPPPRDEFEAMRRRIHQEGKAAADEMRRSADPPEQR
jgi:hypothetical protein